MLGIRVSKPSHIDKIQRTPLISTAEIEVAKPDASSPKDIEGMLCDRGPNTRRELCEKNDGLRLFAIIN